MNKRILVAGEIAVNSEAYNNLCILCDQFGSRFFATSEEKASADFLAKKLHEYGLQNIQVEPYTLFGWNEGEFKQLWSWERGTASLEIVEPVQQQLSCISLANAPSTPEDGVSAEIFVLESAKRDYILEHRNDLVGKFVLDGTYATPRGYFGSRDPMNLYRPTLYGYLAEFGAAGMIFISRHYGNLPPTGAARFGSIGEIPACGIA